VAVKVAEVPAQVVAPVAVGVDGMAFTVTITGTRVLLHPLTVDST
jgi:hypothetical protein